MSNPTAGDMLGLKRLGRYLKLYPRVVFRFPFQSMPNKIDVYSDTDWAGCLRTRKSTQGGAVLIGQHCFKHWSSTQSIIALSSGEAEYYGIVKATSVGFGVQSMMKDMGIPMDLYIHTDAEAAKGIASRKGLGKIRHLHTHYLWVQERVRNGDIVLKKVWGAENPADLLTKHLDHNRMVKLMSKFSCNHELGRALEAPNIM